MNEPLLYPAATWRPVRSQGGDMVDQRGLVEHITTNDFSPYGFFSDPAHKASSDLWIAADGAVEQYVDLRKRAWAQAAGNGTWNSAEISGKVGTLKTPEQCEALAQLLAWGHLHPELLWPLTPSDDPATPGVGWHGMGAKQGWGHPYCPGPARVAQTRAVVIPRAIELVQLTQTPTVQQEDDMYAVISDPRTGGDYGTNGISKFPFGSQQAKSDWAKAFDAKRLTLSAAAFDAIPTVAAR